MVLEGQDISNRRPLPFPVGLTGIHAGAEPLGNVVARFFPERLMMILDLDTQQPIEPLALRLLKAGKSRAVYDLVRADQTHPTNHPFAPPSTDCGRREKGEGENKDFPKESSI